MSDNPNAVMKALVEILIRRHAEACRWNYLLGEAISGLPLSDDHEKEMLGHMEIRLPSGLPDSVNALLWDVSLPANAHHQSQLVTTYIR